MIVNRQKRIPIPLRRFEEFLSRAQRRLKLSKESMTICLVSDREMERWNRAHRGERGPTDVLSFPTDASNTRLGRPRKHRPQRNRQPGFPAFSTPNGSAAYLGDIAIAPAVARRNARCFGRTFDDEMRILILHGMLHLMGYDHEADEGQMERREARLRRQLGLA